LDEGLLKVAGGRLY